MINQEDCKLKFDGAESRRCEDIVAPDKFQTFERQAPRILNVSAMNPEKVSMAFG